MFRPGILVSFEYYVNAEKKSGWFNPAVLYLTRARQRRRGQDNV
jgi:hypothetical protein